VENTSQGVRQLPLDVVEEQGRIKANRKEV
jgi:hypothetical protein